MTNQLSQCAELLANACNTIEELGGEIHFDIYMDGQRTTYITGQDSFEMEEVGDHFMSEVYQDLQNQEIQAEEMLFQLCHLIEVGKNEKTQSLIYRWKQLYGKPTFTKLKNWIDSFDKPTNQRIYQATKENFGAE